MGTKLELNGGFLTYSREGRAPVVYMTKIEKGVLSGLFISDHVSGQGDTFGNQRLVELAQSYDVTEKREHPDLPSLSELEQEIIERGLA